MLKENIKISKTVIHPIDINLVNANFVVIVNNFEGVKKKVSFLFVFTNRK